MNAALERLPLVLFEDDHLLVVNKPPGLNTHAPAPFATEGLYDWLRHREPRWASLALLHRLDKETSGVLIFGKSTEANRSLTRQFTEREVEKRYQLVTDRPVASDHYRVVSSLTRVGDKYVSRLPRAGADTAETEFHVRRREGDRTVLEARPLTGRTHQIRVHAAHSGFPILGDLLYGGSLAARLHLHAKSLALQHPVTNAPLRFEAAADFETPPAVALRAALIDPNVTDAFRCVHGASDGWPGWYLDRLSQFFLAQSEQPPDAEVLARLRRVAATFQDRFDRTGTNRGGSVESFDNSRFVESGPAKAGATSDLYYKLLTRHVRATSTESAAPRPLAGIPAPERFETRENGLRFAVSFREGYSFGLFLDQRDNRHRLLRNHVAADFALWTGKPPRPKVLNAFAYTCGFSVCAALAGARTTSLDLSRKYLDWGRHNFELNKLDPAAHDFLFGDVFDWFRRLRKKQRAFDTVLLDPPTFSQSKQSGVFRAEKDYARLVDEALPLLKRDGVLFCSTNAAGIAPEQFVTAIERAVRAAGRRILQKHYAPQPPDFPVSRAEPAYLKTLWLRLA